MRQRLPEMVQKLFQCTRKLRKQEYPDTVSIDLTIEGYGGKETIEELMKIDPGSNCCQVLHSSSRG